MGLTLLQKGSFEFHNKANVPKKLEKNLNDIGYNCLFEVLLEKMRAIQLKPNLTVNQKTYYLEGRTGSGKSTFLPSRLFLDMKTVTVWVVEPVVILAKSIAIDILEFFPGLKLGENVGYLTGQGKIKPTNKTSLIYMTTEIFRQQLLSNPKNIPDIVIFDEVHKLDKPLLFCLNSLKENLAILNKTLFIFQSATINIPLMQKYFIGEEDYSYDVVGYIKGSKNYPCEEKFLDDKKIIEFQNNKEKFVDYLMTEIVSKSLKTDNYIVENNKKIPARDIMVFVCGKRTISDIRMIFENYKYKLPIYFMDIDKSSYQKVIDWRMKYKNKTRILIVPYLQSADFFGKDLLQTNIDPNEEAQQNEIKIYISTPVLEAGKTLDTLYQVLDNGLKHNVYYNPLLYNNETIAKSIIRLPTDRRSIEQRIGRVGRKSPGVIIHLYSKKAFDKISENSVPDPVNMVSYTNIIDGNSNNKSNIIDLLLNNDFIIPVSFDTCIRTYNDLFNIGYITSFGYNMKKEFKDNSILNLSPQTFIMFCLRKKSYMEILYIYYLLRKNFPEKYFPILDPILEMKKINGKQKALAILEVRKFINKVFD